jgi:hypothetical protein
LRDLCKFCVIKEFPCEIKDLVREEDLCDQQKRNSFNDDVTCDGNKRKICKEIFARFV